MRTFLLFAGAVLAAGAAMAQISSPSDEQLQRLISSHHIIYFGDSQQVLDSVQKADLIESFYLDQYRHAQDPRAPYFMLMSRGGKMAMGIGGKIQALAFYDMHGMVDGNGFAPYNIPITTNPLAPNGMQMNMGNSAIFLTAFGNDRHFGNYIVYLEAKFTGNNNHYFTLKKAYATVGDWTLGLAKSTFTDPSSQPSTVETVGPNSEVDATRFLLRWMHQLPGKWTVAASIENATDNVAATQYSALSSTYMPNIAAFIQYGTQKQHVRLSGILKNMRYRDLVAGNNQYVTGWGVNLTTCVRPLPALTVFAGANTGKGIGSLVNDLSQGSNDLIGYADRLGKMYAPTSFGYYGALQYNFRPNLFSTLIFSQERILPKHHSLYDGDQYKYGLYGTANVFYSITPRCVVGAEFTVGKRANMDHSSHVAYRAGLTAEFSF